MCLVSICQIKRLTLCANKVTFFTKCTFDIVQHDFGSGFNCVIMGAACDDIQRFGIGMLQTVTEFCHIPTVLQNEIGCDLPVNLMFNDDIKHLAAVVNNGINSSAMASSLWLTQ